MSVTFTMRWFERDMRRDKSEVVIVVVEMNVEESIREEEKDRRRSII